MKNKQENEDKLIYLNYRYIEEIEFKKPSKEEIKMWTKIVNPLYYGYLDKIKNNETK